MAFSGLFSGSFQLLFKNEHIVYENEVRCIVKESEYNLSYNPTLLVSGSPYITAISSSASGSIYTLTGSLNSTLKFFATGSTLPSGSYFTPYATTIGLYNDNNELLAVAKMSKPLTKDFTKEALIRVKLDW